MTTQQADDEPPVAPAVATPPAGEVPVQLTVAAVARRLGIAPATLRTWDRRYGLGPGAHAPGTHRRYGPADLARLEAMQGALLQGATPAEAARLALGPGPSEAVSAPQGPGGERRISPPVPAGDPSAPDDGEEEPDPGARIRVGGRVLRMPGASRRARGVGRAALAMDAPAVRRLVAEAVEADGLETTWDAVVRPVLSAIAGRWAASGAGVEIEHLVSEAVGTVYGSVYGTVATSGSTTPERHRPVLLAGAPGELHYLPLVALGAVLAERGVSHRPLGANLPADALGAAVRRTAPAAVVVWAQDPETADPTLFTALPRTRPRYRSFAAGPGWTDARLPPRVMRLDSLRQAADTLQDPAGIPHTY